MRKTHKIPYKKERLCCGIRRAEPLSLYEGGGT